MRLHLQACLAFLILCVFTILTSGCGASPLPSPTPRRVQRPTAHRVTLGNDRITYWSAGEGAPLLLLHGFGPSGLWQFLPQLRALSATRRVIAPDLVYFGRSTTTEDDFSPAHQVRMLRALLAHLEIERTDLLGLSYGGLIAYDLASTHPDQIGRLILVASPGRHYTPEDHQALLERMEVAHIAELMLPRDEAGVRRIFTLTYAAPPHMPRDAIRNLLRTDYETQRDEKRAVLDFLQTREAVERTITPPTQPTLIIWGADDPIFPQTLAHRLAQALGGRAALEIIPEARHMPHLEHPERVNARILQFLSEDVE